MKIGIGITTHNRNQIAEETVRQIRYFAPSNSKIVIVDDASKKPFNGATFRFDVNVGIATAKNKCLELLDDCDYIFLFDDDCYPKVKDWHLPYINSGINHLSFTFPKLKNGKNNGNNILYSRNGITSYSNPCGCMIFFTNKCLDYVGGFNTEYTMYSFEHVDLSNRIFNNKLTPDRFLDVSNSIELFHSLDYESSIQSSVKNKSQYFLINSHLYKKNYNSKDFIPYKETPKIKHNNIILTSYFNYSHDPQRGVKWSSELESLNPLIESCIKHKQTLLIFTDCNHPQDSKYIKFIKTIPSKSHSPNVYRWIVYQDWMRNNTFNKIWMVDSTDVVLLRNPFDIINDGMLYCGDEYDMLTDNQWMRVHQERYLHIDDYRIVISRYAKERLINCGLVGGGHFIMVGLVNTWANLHKTHTVGLRVSTDMAIFNYVARKYYNYILVTGEKINTKFKHEEQNNKIAIWKHK